MEIYKRSSLAIVITASFYIAEMKGSEMYWQLNEGQQCTTI